jgi:protein-S-isoprenylcysteine O-methyltransferase Ste14
MALRTELRIQGNFLFKNRSYLPLIILLVGLCLYVYKEVTILPKDELPRVLFELGCFGVSVFGLMIRFVTIGFSADNTSGRNTVVGQVADSINVTGPYSLVRHPLYLGNFFMWLGVAAFTFDFWFVMAFIFLYWVYYERIMFAEEEFLIDKYGEDYIRYSATVPSFLPRFSGWVKPKFAFSWRKIIRQEKAGILNLFLVILVFRGLGELFAGDYVQIENYWLLGFGISLLWYITIKIIQNKTNYLALDR